MAVALTHTTVAVGTDAGNGEIAKAQWNENHTLTAAVDNLLGTTSLSTTVVEIPCTSAGRALLDDADAAAQRTTLSAAGTGVSNTFSANQIISVTDNANAALRVTQLGTGNAILVEDSTNPDATPFVVNSSGSVGIGTTAPDALLSVNGIASFGAGAASTPSIAAFGDLNTGMWYPAADTIAWSTGGTERLRVSSTGQVGINVTPTAEFDLNGNYAANIVAMAALDVDCSAGNYFTKTINGASTFTFSNAPASRAYSFTLELTHTSGAVTWPTSVKWPSDVAPTLTTGKTHLFMFVTDDGGTRWRGSYLINYTN